MADNKGIRTALEYYLLENPRIKIKFDAKKVFEQFNKLHSTLHKEGVSVKVLSWAESQEKDIDKVYKIAAHGIEDKAPIVFTTDNNVTRSQLFGEEIKFCIMVNNKKELDMIKLAILDLFQDAIPTKTRYNSVKQLRVNKQFVDTKVETYLAATFSFKLLKLKKIIAK